MLLKPPEEYGHYVAFSFAGESRPYALRLRDALGSLIDNALREETSPRLSKLCSLKRTLADGESTRLAKR